MNRRDFCQRLLAAIGVVALPTVVAKKAKPVPSGIWYTTKCCYDPRPQVATVATWCSGNGTGHGLYIINPVSSNPS